MRSDDDTALGEMRSGWRATKRVLRRLLSGTHLNRRAPQLAILVLIAVGLQVAAAAGLSYVAGFHAVDAVLGRFHPIWLVGIAGALVLSFVGYAFAYRGVFVVEGGPRLHPRTFAAVVAAGFGGFLARGGSTLDKFALEGAGVDEWEANARVSALAGIEHGVLGIGGWATALAVLAIGLGRPPWDFTYPWAIVPIPGFALAFWLAEKYRERFHDVEGWRKNVGIFLDAVHYARKLFLRPWEYPTAIPGMFAFWAADAFAVWCGLRAFGFSMDAAQLFIGFATGMAFTRRTGPLGGAGVLTLTVPLTLWYSGAPLAVAVVGFFVYQIFSLWLPLPFSIASLPTLRRIGNVQTEEAPDRAGDSGGEPALREAG